MGEVIFAFVEPETFNCCSAETRAEFPEDARTFEIPVVRHSDYAALEARVRELEADKQHYMDEAAKWLDTAAKNWQAYQAATDRAEQAEAALSVAQKDAERLDWLHDNISGDELYDAMYPHYRLRLANLREAIDAKMAENTIAHGGAGEGESNA